MSTKNYRYTPFLKFNDTEISDAPFQLFRPGTQAPGLLVTNLCLEHPKHIKKHFAHSHLQTILITGSLTYLFCLYHHWLWFTSHSNSKYYVLYYGSLPLGCHSNGAHYVVDPLPAFLWITASNSACSYALCNLRNNLGHPVQLSCWSWLSKQQIAEVKCTSV